MVRLKLSEFPPSNIQVVLAVLGSASDKHGSIIEGDLISLSRDLETTESSTQPTASPV